MKKRQILIGIIITVIYAIIRFSLFENIPVTITNDSNGYIDIAKMSIFDKYFWVATRPFSFPLLIKFFNYNLNSLVTFQFIYSIVSWTFFASVISGKMKLKTIKIFAFLFIICFSLTTDVILWDSLIRTESVNISTSVLLLALILNNDKQKSKFPTLLIWLITVFWVFLKDTNAWMILVISGLLSGYYLINKKNIRDFAKPFLLLFLFFVAYSSSSVRQRWVGPLLNVISMRILPTTIYLDQFEKLGMPINDELLSLKSIKFSTQYYDNPKLDNYLQWVYTEGKRDYFEFLINNPRYLIKSPIQNWGMLSGYLLDTEGTVNDNLDYAPKNFQEFYSYTISEILYPKKNGIIVLIISLLISFFLFLKLLKNRNDREFDLILILLLSSYPMILLNYHGDGAGISRHALSSIMQLNISCWLFFIFYIDRFVTNKLLH